MRVVLVGSDATRARLRRRAETAGLDVVAEFPTLTAARAAGVAGDAILVSTDRDASGDESDWIEEPLTSREMQVLELLAEGRSNRAIADCLGISDQTVKSHVATILGKLGAHTRTEAVRRAVRRGLITL